MQASRQGMRRKLKLLKLLLTNGESTFGLCLTLIVCNLSSSSECWGVIETADRRSMVRSNFVTAFNCMHAATAVTAAALEQHFLGISMKKKKIHGACMT